MEKQLTLGNYAKIKYIRMLFLAFLCIVPIISAERAQAAVLKIRYNDTTYSYTGTQAGVTVDGKSISLGKNPGILQDNTVLLPAEDVFKEHLGAAYSYNSSSGEITLSAYGNEMLFYLNSTTAYVNGEKVTLDTTPLEVKYVKAEITKILIPARATAEGLGFGYLWNSSKKRAEFTIPFKLYYNDTWTTYEGVQGKVTVNGKTVSLGKMPAIEIDGCLMVPSKKVFTAPDMDTNYSYDQDSGTITIDSGDWTVIYTIDSTDVLVNGKKLEAPQAPRLITNSLNNTVYVMVPLKFTVEQFEYLYAWLPSKKTAEIYTSEDQMLGETGYFFTTDNTQEYQSYIDTVSNLKQEAQLKGSGSGATITGIYEHEGAEHTERYIISANAPLGNIDAIYDPGKRALSVTLSDTSSESASYPFGKPVIESASMEYDTTTGKTLAIFQSTADQINYKLSLSEDECNLYVDIYDNCLADITGQKGTNNREALVLTGAQKLAYSYVSGDGILTLTFPHTCKGFETNAMEISDSNFLKNISVEEQDDHSLIMKIAYTGDFYIQSSGVRLQLIFYDASSNNGDSEFDLYIPLPSAVKFSNVTDSDPYADKKFKIRVPGDYVSYYKQNQVLINNSVIKGVDIDLNDDETLTVLTIRMSKIQGYHYYDADNGIGVNIGGLRKMYKNIVLLDAGHGGKDSGATNGKYKEKNFNLTILYKKAKEYFNQSDDIKAFWTRANDTFIDLYERPKLTKKAKADLFISLHMNSAGSSSAKGLEVYYSKKNTSKGPSGLTSKKMASYFQDSLISKLECADRGFKSADFVVVKYNTVPAVLIELGFITNNTDLNRLKNSTQQKKAAKAIFDTVEEIFEKYPTGR